MSSGVIRWGAIGFMLSGVAYIVQSLTEPSRVSTVAFIAALILMSVGLIGLHALQGGSYGRLGRVGLYTAIISNALLIAGTVVFWPFLLGSLGNWIGLVLYGAATIRAGLLPRWYGWVLIGLMPSVTITSSFLLFGLLLLVLGYTLWLRREAPAAQPSRVS